LLAANPNNHRLKERVTSQKKHKTLLNSAKDIPAICREREEYQKQFSLMVDQCCVPDVVFKMGYRLPESERNYVEVRF
jgi:hypothetical protein